MWSSAPPPSILSNGDCDYLLGLSPAELEQFLASFRSPLREAVQQQLLALGATDGGPCDTIPKPAPIGSACLDTFHHDAHGEPKGMLQPIKGVIKYGPADSWMPCNVLN